MQLGAIDLIDTTLTLDPDFALAHCVKARTWLLIGDVAAATASVSRAGALATNRSDLSERERRHIGIVALVTQGDSVQALSEVRIHAAEYPRDALPLSFALGVYGLLGFSGAVDHHAQQRDLLESVAGHWDDDWWFSTNLGWSYVETGQFERGIQLLDRALAIQPDNANAAHGRTHGYYETGAAAEGETFLADWLPTYDRANPLHCHLAWHRALFALQMGDIERAVGIYHDSIKPSVSLAVPMFTMIDCASFVWRGLVYGHPLPRADVAELLDFTLEHFPKAGLHFVNVHAALVFAAAGETKRSKLHLAAVDERLAQGRQPCGPMISELCMGISSYGNGDYDDAARRLGAVQRDFDRIGGSHAQRDVLIDTIIGAQLKSHDPRQATDTLNARMTHRAPHLDETWMNRLPRAG